MTPFDAGNGERGPVESTAAAITEQRLRWTTPVTQPLMLCSQVQRSGGTLLARLFDGHPGCFAHPNELRWGKPKRWPEIALPRTETPDELFAQVAESWPRKFAVHGYHKYSNWTHQHHPEEARRYPFLFDESLQRRIFAAEIERQCGSQRDVLNAYLTSLFNAWLDYQNLYTGPKRWVTAFEPRLILSRDGVDRFFADYPDGLLVTLVREPGAWLSSYSRHAIDEDTGTALRHWRESVEASTRAHAARSAQVMVILFDDLVLRTETVMRALCQRMGLAFGPALLEPTYNSIPILSDSSHELVTGIDRRVTERYQAALTPEQSVAVAHHAADVYGAVKERFALA